MRVIGMDLGFGFCKVVSGDEAFIFPSIVGSGDDDILKVSGMKSSDVEEETVVVDDMRLLVGESAMKHALRTFPAREKNWIDSLTYRALLSHALRLTGVGPGHLDNREITIVTGLPVSHYRSCKDRLAGLIKKTTGDEVEVKVTLQPLGTLFDQLFNDDMSIRDQELSTDRVGIIDIGFFTTDLVTVDGLEFVKKQLGSYEGGLSSAYSAIARDIYNAYELKKEVFEVERVVRDGYVRVFGKREDVRSIVERCLRDLATEIAAQARTIWQDGADIDRVLITGGGAVALRGHLDLYRHAEFVTGSQLSNARGYVKFGRRLFYGRS